MTTIREQVNPVGINDLSGPLALLFVHINANAGFDFVDPNFQSIAGLLFVIFRNTFYKLGKYSAE